MNSNNVLCTEIVEQTDEEELAIVPSNWGSNTFSTEIVEIEEELAIVPTGWVINTSSAEIVEENDEELALIPTEDWDSNSALVIQINGLPSPSPSPPPSIPSLWEDFLLLKRRGFFSVMALRLFMAFISAVYLVAGLEKMEKTGLSKSVSPIFMSFLKYSLAIVTCHSSAWVLLFRSSFKRRHLWLGLAILVMHFFTPFTKKWNPFVYCTIDITLTVFKTDSKNDVSECCKVCSFWIAQSWVFEKGEKMNFSPDLVLAISIFISAVWMEISDMERLLTSSLPSLINHSRLDGRIKKFLPLALALVNNFLSTLKEKNMMVKLIKFALGLVGSVLFQNYFRLTTFDHVTAFFCLAVTWLINLTLISASNDFGVLNFLLANMIAGSTVNQFGLGIKTWLMCGACFLLFHFRVKLKSSNTS